MILFLLSQILDACTSAAVFLLSTQKVQAASNQLIDDLHMLRDLVFWDDTESLNVWGRFDGVSPQCLIVT